VPMCLLAAISGVWLVGSDNNIFTQVGLVVLIGLAAKNAILIVEFAKQLQDEGKPRFESIVEASKTRLRPILMTSFAFILVVLPAKVRSVVPLLRVEAHQPRDEDRQVHLPAYSLDDRQPACRLADRHHIAVAERRERDEAEVRSTAPGRGASHPRTIRATSG